MAPPSKLNIATSSVQRLVKEEASYHKELEQQEIRIKRFETETGDENSGFLLKQERKAMDETKAIFAPLRKRIAEAREELKNQIDNTEGADHAELQKAKEILSQTEPGA